jgi:hypothetical protein
MRARADLLISAKQYPRHCFANISVDHYEFGRWQYRNELRGQNASPLLPVIDADVVAEGLGARIGNKVSRKAGKFFCEVLHCFPAQFLGALSARHNATTMRSARASELASQRREFLAAHVPAWNRFATGRRA